MSEQYLRTLMRRLEIYEADLERVRTEIERLLQRRAELTELILSTSRLVDLERRPQGAGGAESPREEGAAQAELAKKDLNFQERTTRARLEEALSLYQAWERELANTEAQLVARRALVESEERDRQILALEARRRDAIKHIEALRALRTVLAPGPNIGRSGDLRPPLRPGYRGMTLYSAILVALQRARRPMSVHDIARSVFDLAGDDSDRKSYRSVNRVLSALLTRAVQQGRVAREERGSYRWRVTLPEVREHSATLELPGIDEGRTDSREPELGAPGAN